MLLGLIVLWLWTIGTNCMVQAQGLMLMLHTLILQISKCGKCFKCDLCIFKCTCPCIGPPADMHLCRRVLGRQICRVHMCPGHSVPDTCVGYTDTCSLISHLWHFRTITIKIRSKCIVWLIQTKLNEIIVTLIESRFQRQKASLNFEMGALERSSLTPSVGGTRK